MKNWKATADYQKIAEANRQYYARTAELYENTESCVHDKAIQADLAADLDQILAMFSDVSRPISALDACGGSGNVSLKLLKRGVEITLVDISPELQAIFRLKSQAAGYPSRIVCSEIGKFLAEETRTYDLIIFSSALHHLENIDAVLKLAFDRLAPGGLLFTIFDPTLQKQQHRLSRLAFGLEYYAFKIFIQTADLPKAVGRRLRRMLSGASVDHKLSSVLNDDTIGMLAEFHVGTGIDDVALVERMKQAGYEVVWHHRYAEARFKLTRRVVGWTGDSTTFKLLLRKPAASSSV